MLAVSIGAALFAAPLVPPAAADQIESGSTTFELSPGLDRSLDRHGVRLKAVRPGRARRGSFKVPLVGETLAGPAGRLRYSGGVTLTSRRRAATLSRLVLDTSRGRLSARLGGRPILLASTGGVSVRRRGFGSELAVRRLLLGPGSARRLNAALGLTRVFRAGRSLASAAGIARFKQVTVTRGTMYLSLDEGFRAELESLGVGAQPFGAGWVFARTPLTFAFTKLHGSAALTLARGSIESTDGFRLTQGDGPEARELALLDISLDFESKAAVADLRAQPSGAGMWTAFADVGFSVVHKNPHTGDITTPNTPSTLTPYLAGLLNETFAEPLGRAPPFAGGQPLGQFALLAATRGLPRD